MEEFKLLQNENDIINTLEHLSIEEKLIEQEVDGLLENESEMELLVKSLVKHMSNISLIESDAQRLSNLMNYTSKLADNVSYKIKSFDLVKSRVSSCLKQVEDIIDLRACTEGIQKALMNEDYEVAARHIYRFLSMDESMLRKSTVEDINGNVDLLDSCSLDQSFAKLHEAEQKLKTIVMVRFDEAAKSEDVASVERFFKIFPLIKQQEEGLNKFSHYLCSQINEKSNSYKTKASTRSAAFLEKLSHLFELIAKTIDIQYPLLETYYGPGNLIHVVTFLQKECDRHSKSIVRDFKNEKNFTLLISSISKILKNPANQNLSKIDPKEIDKHLIDVMYVINRSQTYLNFITNRLLSDLESTDYNKHSDQANSNQLSSFQVDRNKIDNLIRDCTLTEMIHDLNSIYVLLEEYYLKESIYKAIQLDVVDSDSDVSDTVLTSSMLDDIFFIIKKCLKRSISCGSINVILAMINNCVTVLDTSFYEVISELIKNGYPPALSSLDLSNAYNAFQTGRYLQPSKEVQKTRVNFISWLNNLDIACDYINLLSTSITDDVTKSGILQKNQTDLFDSCLSDFCSISIKFKQLITSGMHQLFTAVFKSTVKSMIDSFISSSHTITDEDIISFESTDGLRPFMQTFLMNFSSSVQSFRKQLTSKNFDCLLTVIANEISNKIYKALFKCTFNKVNVNVSFGNSN